MRPPLLIISDGAAGLINAAETSLPRVAAPAVPDPPSPQRPGEGPRPRPAEVKAAYWQVFDIDDVRPRRARRPSELVALVQARIDAFASTYRPSYPVGSEVPACRP